MARRLCLFSVAGCVFVWGHHKHLLMPVFITYYLPAMYDGFYLSMIYIPWGIKIIPQIQGGMFALNFRTVFNHAPISVKNDQLPSIKSGQILWLHAVSDRSAASLTRPRLWNIWQNQMLYMVVGREPVANHPQRPSSAIILTDKVDSIIGDRICHLLAIMGAHWPY